MTNEEIKLLVFKHYSKNDKPCCNNCNIEDIRVLCLDHVNSDGKKHRLEDNQARGINLYKKLYKNNYVSDYKFQLLCYNCNIIKLIENNENKHKKPFHWIKSISEIQKRITKKTGLLSTRAKKCYQYDLDNKFIKEWGYIKEAELFYNKNNKAKNIVACCNKRQKTAYGFIWSHHKKN